MRDWAPLQRCIDLRRNDVAEAVATRDECSALFEHLAAISAPSSGAPLVLLVFARMASTACEWVDGGLYIEAVGRGDATEFDVLQDLGVGLRERLLPRFTMRAPLAEFARALRRIPAMIRPLAAEATEHHIVLPASETVRRSYPPAPHITEAESSLLLMPPTPGFGYVPPGVHLVPKKPT